MEYGDSRDRYDPVWTNGTTTDVCTSYYANDERLTSAKNIARQYVGQKNLPRSVYIRRARCGLFLIVFIQLTFRRWYNSARLLWNSIERKRGPIEDNLIDDLVEWSLWHYPVVRQ